MRKARGTIEWNHRDDKNPVDAHVSMHLWRCLFNVRGQRQRSNTSLVPFHKTARCKKTPNFDPGESNEWCHLCCDTGMCHARSVTASLLRTIRWVTVAKCETDFDHLVKISIGHLGMISNCEGQPGGPRLQRKNLSGPTREPTPSWQPTPVRSLLPVDGQRAAAG